MRISDWGSDVCSSDLPFLVAERREAGAKKTLFSYGHGDVIRGLDAQWRSGISPWALVQEGEKRVGRGTAENKGQHTVNIAVLEIGRESSRESGRKDVSIPGGADFTEKKK